MDTYLLNTVDSSAPLVLLQGDQKAATEEAWGWRETGLAVRVVRGRKMRTVDRLFDEVSAALQFPYYFGENWSAFHECLADMDWLPPSAGIVIMVLDAVEVLCDEPDAEMDVLVRVVGHAANTYAEPIDRGEWWDRPALPFHVVLQASPGDEALVRMRWRASGAGFADFS